MSSLLRRWFVRLPRGVQRFLRLRIRRPAAAVAARIRMALGVRPVSERHGTDRGREIARHYIERRFLPEFATDIHGRVLEFRDATYTVRFGGGHVERSDVLNVEPGIPGTTIRADLTRPNDVPGDAFDCVICTHVLHLVEDYRTVIAELHRVLRPGGVLLVAVPMVSPVDPAWPEMWRFTPLGLRRALAPWFGDTVRWYGGSLAAAAEMRGLAAHEPTSSELDHDDPRFAVEVCARAVKSS